MRSAESYIDDSGRRLGRTPQIGIPRRTGAHAVRVARVAVLRQAIFSTCDACVAAATALHCTCMIASFVHEEQCTEEVVARLSGRLGPPGRPLPPAVMAVIADMLPEVRGVSAAAGLAGVVLSNLGLEF